MNQRGPRLGGIVDDYCPRERRVTDHAIVAMVEDAIKQTRCTTCDDEHPYKRAKVPATRRKKSTLFEQVLETRGEADEAPPSQLAAPRRVAPDASPVDGEALVEAKPSASLIDGEAGTDGGDEPGDGRVHRRLIRATLPRPEGHVPQQTRPLPEFTIRQNGSGYGGQYRDQESRRPPRGGPGSQGNGPDNGQPGNRRPARSRPRRQARPSDDRSPLSGNAGQRTDKPSKSRSRRRHSPQGKKRSK